MASLKRWTRRPRLLPAGAAALTAALALAGCTSGTAGASGTAGTAGASGAPAAGAVTVAQARQVFDAYVAATARATRTNDDALALSVVTGAQQSLVGAAIRLSPLDRVAPVPGPAGARFSGSGFSYVTPNPDGYTYGRPDLLLPEEAGYPRFFVAAVTRAARSATGGGGATASAGGVRVPADGRVLLLFEQAAAAGPWLLASTVQLSPGTALPRLARDGSGYVPQVPLSSTSLLARPGVAGPLQAAVVDDGPASAAATAVAAGPLTTGMYQAARDHAAGLTAPRGDIYQWNLEGSSFPALALRTAAGGALVLYTMYLNIVAAVPDVINKESPIRPGLPITVPPAYRPLLAAHRGAPTESVEVQDLLSFAAVDPPAPAGAAASAAVPKVTVIAVGGGPNYALER